MMWEYGDHMSGAGWAFMWVGMVFFWVALITAIVVLVRYLNKDRDSRPTPEGTPEEILARRFARGEISAEEFLAKTKLIKQ